MNIPIEIITILTILLTLLVWAAWFRWSSNKLIKEYSPEKDVGRPGGINIQKNGKGKRNKEPRIDSDEGREDSDVGGRDSEGEVGTELIPRPTEPAERTILQTATARLSDKNRQRLRGVFDKSRRRR